MPSIASFVKWRHTNSPVYRLALAKIVGEDFGAAATNLAAVLGPDPLPPVAKITRFGHEQVIQGVAVGLAVIIDRAAVKDLVEAAAELLHRLEQVLVALHPADVVRPRAAVQRKARPLALDLGQGLVGGARLPLADAREHLALVDRPACGQHSLRHPRLFDQLQVLRNVDRDDAFAADAADRLPVAAREFVHHDAAVLAVADLGHDRRDADAAHLLPL